MSGTIRVELGQPAPLILQLPDGNSTSGVKASVFDSSNAEIIGSPFVLLSKGAGRYANQTSWVPSVNGTYFATYVVYRDTTYALVNNRYSRATDEFEINQLGSSQSTGTTALSVAVAALKVETDAIKSDTTFILNQNTQLVTGIAALSNAAGFALPIPQTITIPGMDVGSERIRIPFTVYKNGVNSNVDTGTFVVCTLVNQTGFDRSSYLLGNSGGSVNAHALSTGNYYVDLSIPASAAPDQLILMLAYFLSGSLVTRTGVTTLTQSAEATGYALEATLLSVQAKSLDTDNILNDVTKGNSAIAQAISGNSAQIASLEGAGFTPSTDSLRAISVKLARFLHTGGRMVS